MTLQRFSHVNGAKIETAPGCCQHSRGLTNTHLGLADRRGCASHYCT